MVDENHIKKEKGKIAGNGKILITEPCTGKS